MHRFVVVLLVSLLVATGLVVLDGSSRRSQGQAPAPPAPAPSPDQIKRAQERLKAAGWDPGTIDGVLGPQTVTALRDYQRSQGLPVTGFLDDATRATLGVPGAPSPSAATPDAVQEAQRPRAVPDERPEQKQSDHDRSGIFAAPQALPASNVLPTQPDQGKILGFDFFRDPLNAKRPMQTPEEITREDIQAKPQVMAAHRRLLESRYDLTPRFDPQHKMSRGKAIPVGPTARLAQGTTWDTLAGMTPEAIWQGKVFPYPALPHPKQATGGQVFPPMQLAMFPRLERVDVDFDLPEAFLPEFPPALFLQSRPELGDVSRGEVVSINNYYRLFKDLLTPVQLDGLRLLLTPLPQEEFNPTDDRKSLHPSLGITCLDCHVNGHTTAQFHLNPDTRPQERRLRLDTPSLRGVFQQQIHGSKRSVRSVEDFTEFEQRTAYFNGDPIHAMKKGLMILDRVQVSHMAPDAKYVGRPAGAEANAPGAARSHQGVRERTPGGAGLLRQGAVWHVPSPPFLSGSPDA